MWSSLAGDLLKIPGVGHATAAKLQRLGISTIADLLRHRPRRYLDRSAVSPAAHVKDGQWATVIGVVERAESRTSRRSGLRVLEAVLRDESGRIGLVWFYRGKRGWGPTRPPVSAGQRIVASGTVKWTPYGPTIQTPEWEPLPQSANASHPLSPVPVYPLTQGITQSQLRRWIHWALDHGDVADPLPERIRRRHGLLSLKEAYESLHRPKVLADAEAGRRRLAFDELFAWQLEMARAAQERRLTPAFVCPAEVLPPPAFAAKLPFSLTGAQERALARCSAMLEEPWATAALLQGDVGSGKSVVAAYMAARAVLAGHQAALLAPTRLLAEQHQRNFQRLLAPWHIDVALLVSELPAARRRELAERLAAGEPMVVIGTHALLSPDIRLDGCAVGIIDEQHRFGVSERESFARKGKAHLLAMSATPIPRTLALTLYGDLEVIALDEKPPGRQPVDTRWIHPKDRARVYAFVKREVGRGRQAYVVFPRVYGDDEQDQAAVTQAEELARTWLSGLCVGLVHGQMPPEQQEKVMRAFVEGEIDVLVATTVIEVGIDVPNASVMVVEGAERFGLAQLHQLRGRVGRGEHPAYCLLLADPQSDAAKRRIDALRKTDDGFAIAEMDLMLRGPGEMTGLAQAGPLEFKAAVFPQDLDLLQAARDEARRLVEGERATR